MPPSATLHSDSADYDASYAQALMDELNERPTGAIRRALTGLFGLAIGALILGSALTYNPFDSTGDTAGIGAVQNAFGEPGARIANIFMQTVGWGSLIVGALILFLSARGLVRPRPRGTRLEFWGHIALCFAFILFATVTLSAFPIPQTWPISKMPLAIEKHTLLIDLY